MADDERNKDWKDWEDAAKVANEIIDERVEKELKDIDERDNRQWSMKYSELREELTEMYHILNNERRRSAVERLRNGNIQSEQAKTIRRHVEQQKELSEIIEKNREALKKNIKEIARWSAEYDRVCKQRDDAIGEIMRIRKVIFLDTSNKDEDGIVYGYGGQSPPGQEK